MSVRAERGDFLVDAEGGLVTMRKGIGAADFGPLDAAEVRWLQAVALPAALAELTAESPSDPPATMDEPPAD